MKLSLLKSAPPQKIGYLSRMEPQSGPLKTFGVTTAGEATGLGTEETWQGHACAENQNQKICQRQNQKANENFCFQEKEEEHTISLDFPFLMAAAFKD